MISEKERNIIKKVSASEEEKKHLSECIETLREAGMTLIISLRTNRKRLSYTEDDRRKWEQLYAEEISTQKIAEMTGATLSSVTLHLRAVGAIRTKKEARKIRDALAKLDKAKKSADA